jgi:lysozyme family protein
MSQNLKEEVINEIIRVEGGYTNNKKDSGGETNYGITIAVARANGYNGNMKDMPKSVAFNIYSKRYWDSVLADDIAELSESIAREVVDTGVNGGTSRAIKILQQALNVLNTKNGEELYNEITVDGVIGSGTINALKSYLSVRDDGVLLKALNVLQGAFYINLAEEREKDKDFVYGWLKNRVNI